MSPNKIKLIALSAILAAGVSVLKTDANAQTTPSSARVSIDRITLPVGWSDWSESNFFNVYTGFFRTQPSGAPLWIEHIGVGGYEDNNISCPETWFPTIESGTPACRRPIGPHNRMFESEFRFNLLIGGITQNCLMSFQALATAEVTLEQFKALVSRDFVTTLRVPPLSPDMLGIVKPYSFSNVIHSPRAGLHYIATRVSCGSWNTTFSFAELQDALRAAGLNLSTP